MRTRRNAALRWAGLRDFPRCGLILRRSRRSRPRSTPCAVAPSHSSPSRAGRVGHRPLAHRLPSRTIVHGVRVGFCDAAAAPRSRARADVRRHHGRRVGSAHRRARSSVKHPVTRTLLALVSAPLGPLLGICSACGASTAPRRSSRSIRSSDFSRVLSTTRSSMPRSRSSPTASNGPHLLAGGILSAHLAHGEEGLPILRSLRRPACHCSGRSAPRRASCWSSRDGASGTGRPRPPSSRDLGARIGGVPVRRRLSASMRTKRRCSSPVIATKSCPRSRATSRLPRSAGSRRTCSGRRRQAAAHGRR